MTLHGHPLPSLRASCAGFLCSLLAAGSGCADDADRLADATVPESLDESLIIPAELSNAQALGEAANWDDMPTLRAPRYSMQSSRDRGVLDEPPVMLLENGNADMNQFICKSEKADIRYPIFFEPIVDLPECPEDYVSGFVFARFEGAGTLARVWMTALSLSESRADDILIRIYVDDNPEPVLRAPLVQLVSGEASPMFAPPFGAGAAHHLSWHYPLVFSEKLVMSVDHLRSLDLFYHQTSVLAHDESSTREPASEALDGERSRVQALWSALPQGPAADDPTLASVTATVAAGQSTDLIDEPGSGTVRSLALRVATSDLDLLGELGLQIFFDGSPTPAIDVSAAALFAAYDEPAAVPSLALSTRTEDGSTIVELRLPMPFRSRVEVRAENASERDLPLNLRLRAVDELPSEPFGHLHAVQGDMSKPASERYTVLEADGPGRLVGACMSMQGHAAESFGEFGVALNFLEGDETIELDGQQRIRGTGTEDYFDSSFYFGEGDFGTTFAQGWGIHVDNESTPKSGRVSTCRWHLFHDGIDFEESISFEFEVGPGIPETLDRYQSTAFFYQ